MLAAPTIAEWGTPLQIANHVLGAVTGRHAWCQLFSEPVAGSDLAGLRTTAVQVDDNRWVVNGQKVWTSFGGFADRGMLLARTDTSAPKHKGITWFVINMDQPGVTVRPLREMTGEALFCEVFLDDAVVESAAAVGPVNGGWGVAKSTLGYERLGLGPTAGGQKTKARPGSKAGDLASRAGDMVGEIPAKRGPRGTPARKVAQFARSARRDDDRVVRDQMAQLHILCELGRLNAERHRDARGQGVDIPGMGNIGKLLNSQIVRLQRDVGLGIAGPAGMLHAYEDGGQAKIAALVHNPMVPWITGLSLYAQAPSIYGGTDEIQKNILAESVLGLPSEPLPARETPFSHLPPNV
jgi:alkylation response protein AidB-like acyl-CoA dehydrogenase